MHIPTPPPLPPAVFLEIIFGAEAGRRYPLGMSRLVVGRGEDVQFILDDPTVSRQHAAVWFEGGTYRLRDLDSANGTRVEGREVKEAVLTAGTTVELGGAILRVGLGEAADEAPATGPLYRQDTEKLPVLDAPVPEERETPPDQTPRRILGMQRSSSSRSLAPSPRFSQIVSWLVVLCIVMGGVMLLLNLLDAGVTFDTGGSGDTLSISAPRQDPAQQVVKPPQKKKNDEDSSLGDLPVDEAPDVAQEKYSEAEAARAAGDLQTALAILLEVGARYPEFQPTGNSTVPEQVSKLERAIAYAGILSWGNQVLADETSDAIRLQHLLSELTAIPATEREFGEVAIELADQTRQRLREVMAGDSHPQPKADEVQPPDPAEVVDIVEAADVPEALPEENSPAVEEALATARQRADELYQGRAFGSAASRLKEAAETLPTGDERSELEERAATLIAFEESFSEARRLARKQGEPLLRAEALERALGLDGKLAGKYARELRTELAVVLVEEAKKDFEREQYEAARQYLDRARKHDRSGREVSQLSTLFAFRGSSLVRAAKAAPDATQRRRLLGQARLLATPGSTLDKEVTILLDELGGEAR